MIFDINEEQLVTNVSVLLKMPTSFTVSIGDEVTFVDCSLNVVITPVDKKSVICNRTGRYVKIAGTSTSDNIDICHVEIMNKNCKFVIFVIFSKYCPHFYSCITRVQYMSDIIAVTVIGCHCFGTIFQKSMKKTKNNVLSNLIDRV